MNKVEKQRILDVLNSLEVIETNGGEDAYILVANNKENQGRLNAVGVSTETIYQYGDEETFCILALAFGKGYADWYDGELISFDNEVQVECETGDSVNFFKYKGEVFVGITNSGGYCSSVKLNESQLNSLREII